MTLIVAALFLPYTVEFEVQADENILKQNPTSTQQDVTTPVILQPPTRPTVTRPSLSKQASTADSVSILRTMAKQQQQLASPELYSSLNNSTTNVLLNEDDLSRASVEDFFYHHPKLRGSPTAPGSQMSSGTITPQESESNLASQQYSQLLRSALNSSTYIQPRARTPPVMNPSAVVGPTKMELQTPSVKVILRTKSATNLAPRNPPARTKSSLHKVSQKSGFSSSDNVSKSYEAVFDDSGIEEDDDMDDDSGTEYDSQHKVAPYGGESNPDVNQFVSNRSDFFKNAPFKVCDLRRGNISLVKAVETAKTNDVISQDQIWVGSCGMPSDEVPDSTREKISDELRNEHHSETIFIDDITFQGHYKSFCKQILWPTLHYQIPDNPNSKVFEENSWSYYQAVNEQFAEKIISLYHEGDVIWIHDYHLLLLPQLIRKKLPNAKIGLFLHVAFPSSEVFRCFAQRINLLEGMLGANVISFQSEEYVRHFVQTCNRLLLSDFTDEGIKYDNRTILINHIPIGIDAKPLKEKLTTSPEVKYWQKLIKQRWPNKKLIVTRDKLDRIRGIKQKLLAYEKFLNKNPEMLDEVILIQICLPTNSPDEELESNIYNIVDRINSKSNNISIAQPVVFLNQDIDFEQYLSLLTEAETFIVSTMREGMNLTCHEFIVSTYMKHSPLILSEFTGSASILKNGAILINPWDIKQMSELFELALTQPEKEKLRNWEILNDIVYRNDSNNWVKNCVNSIMSSWDAQLSREIPNSLTTEIFQDKYNNANVNSAKRVILINLENFATTVQYEGTKLSTIEIPVINNVLNNLTSDSKNVVYVMSYSRKSDLAASCRQVSNVGLIAENGGFVRTYDSNKWYTLSSENLKWKPAVVEYVNAVVERLPNSSIEIEDCTIRVHLENVNLEDEERKITLIGELITHVNDVFANENIHATLIDEVVVIQQIDLPQKLLQFVCSTVGNKGNLDLNYKNVPDSPSSVTSFSGVSDDVNFTGIDNISLMCIIGGQSPIDESLFKYGIELKNNGKVNDLLTVEVGKATKSLANQYVGGINELLNILKSV